MVGTLALDPSRWLATRAVIAHMASRVSRFTAAGCHAMYPGERWRPRGGEPAAASAAASGGGGCAGDAAHRCLSHEPVRSPVRLSRTTRRVHHHSGGVAGAAPRAGRADVPGRREVTAGASTAASAGISPPQFASAILTPFFFSSRFFLSSRSFSSVFFFF